MLKSEKPCVCGHDRNEHVWIQKSVSKLAFLGEGFFRTPQEGRGACKKCSCWQYETPSKFKSSRDVMYTERQEVTEECRCTRCGTLFDNHDDLNHSFQYRK